MTTPMAAKPDLRSLKALHDRLLESKPDDAEHDFDSCALCAYDDTAGGSDEGTEDMSTTTTTTFTEDQLNAKVEEIVGPLQTRIRELEEAAGKSETEAAVAAAVADKDGVIADLQRQLDEKVVEAEAQRERADLLVAWLEGEATAQQEAESIKARKDDRLAKVAEVAKFPEDYLEEHGDRIAAMSDEDFAFQLETWARITADNGGSDPSREIPRHTGLHASREGEGGGGRRTGSALKEVMSLRRNGPVDLSAL